MCFARNFFVFLFHFGSRTFICAYTFFVLERRCGSRRMCSWLLLPNWRFHSPSFGSSILVFWKKFTCWFWNFVTSFGPQYATKYCIIWNSSPNCFGVVGGHVFSGVSHSHLFEIFERQHWSRKREQQIILLQLILYVSLSRSSRAWLRLRVLNWMWAIFLALTISSLMIWADGIFLLPSHMIFKPVKGFIFHSINCVVVHLNLLCILLILNSSGNSHISLRCNLLEWFSLLIWACLGDNHYTR